jgi:hypothetical protein
MSNKLFFAVALSVAAFLASNGPTTSSTKGIKGRGDTQMHQPGSP